MMDDLSGSSHMSRRPDDYANRKDFSGLGGLLDIKSGTDG